MSLFKKEQLWANCSRRSLKFKERPLAFHSRRSLKKSEESIRIANFTVSPTKKLAIRSKNQRENAQPYLFDIVLLYLQERERMEVEEEENSRNLVIRRVEPKDKGLYTCQVQNNIILHCIL